MNSCRPRRASSARIRHDPDLLPNRRATRSPARAVERRLRMPDLLCALPSPLIYGPNALQIMTTPTQPAEPSKPVERSPRTDATARHCTRVIGPDIRTHPLYVLSKELEEINAMQRREAAELRERNEKLMEFVARISKQKPEKPDYWCECGQCGRNIDEAQELIAALSASKESAG